MISGTIKTKNNTMIPTLWVVEWSDAQQCYHIDLMHKCVANNMGAFINNRPIQYSIIAVCETEKEADEWFEKLDRAKEEQKINL